MGETATVVQVGRGRRLGSGGGGIGPFSNVGMEVKERKGGQGTSEECC